MIRRLLVLFPWLFAGLVATSPCLGQSLIPVANRRDHVFGRGGRVLYISTEEGYVARYDLVRRRLLPSWGAGRELLGIDVSPDGSALFAAEGRITWEPQTGFVRRIDTTSGAATSFDFPLDDGEDGIADLAVAANGTVLLSAEFRGSGGVKLRQLDPATGAVAARSGTSQSTRLHRSLDGSTLFLVGPNNSGGPVALYDAATDELAFASLNRFLTYEPSAIDAAGERMAVGGGCGIEFLDRTLQPLAPLCGPATAAIVFDPVDEDLLHWVDRESSELVTFDLTSATELSRVPTGANLTYFYLFDEGMASISGDGTFLALSVDGGVRLYELAPSDDADGDGAADGADVCPLDPDPGQEDRDTDGVGDACDACPDTADPDQADADADGLGDACDPFSALALQVRASAPGAGLTSRPTSVTYRLETEDGAPVDTAGARATLTVDRGARFAEEAGAGILLDGAGTDRVLVEFVDGVVTLGVIGPAAPARARLDLVDSEGHGLQLAGDVFATFEEGAQGFEGTPGAWARVRPSPFFDPRSAFSGEWVWSAQAKAYLLPEPARLVSPIVSIGSGPAPVLEFQSFVSIGLYEEARLEISGDGGGSWAPVASPRPPGPAGYRLQSFDLFAFRGRDVRFRWEYDTWYNLGLRGWHLDDFRVVGAVPAIEFLDEASDQDGDGLSNGTEVEQGTDPLRADGDDDEQPDGEDNCPFVFNPSQADGIHPGGEGDACADADGDSVPDVEDLCPDHPDPPQANLDHDSLGDVCDPHPEQSLRVRILVPSEGTVGDTVLATYRLETPEGTPITGLDGIALTATIEGPAVFEDEAPVGVLLEGGGSRRARIELAGGLATLAIRAGGPGLATLGGEDSERLGIAVLGSVFEDFEADAGGFETTGLAWEHGVPTSGPGGAFSGSRVWATVLDGPHPHNADASLVSPVVPLASGSKPRLEFRAWWAFEYFHDHLEVEASTDRGATWQRLTSLGSTSNGQYRSSTQDLASFAGADLQVRFRLTSDVSVAEAGAYLDDFSVRDVDTTIRFVPEPGGAIQALLAMATLAWLVHRAGSASSEGMSR